MLEKKVKEIFPKAVVFKDPKRNKVISSWGIPGFLRDWLVKKFTSEDGILDFEELKTFVDKYIPKKEDWEGLKSLMMHSYEKIKILTRVRFFADVETGETLFSLPDFGFPRSKFEAIVDRRLIERKRNEIFESSEGWGIVELEWRIYRIKGKDKGVIFMTDFKPFRPYKVNLRHFQEASAEFSIREWMDITLSAVDYNPKGFLEEQKKAFILRLLPFVEKRVNIIELAPKGTGKSYLFSQISKYGWLVSGGSLTRAKLFYDLSKKQRGLVTRYDYVALDEIQSISFPDEEEIRGALKGYLESGEFRIGDYYDVADAGFVLLGNIKRERMRADINMFEELPKVFHESALIDRFHGFIPGWDIPRMKESMKYRGWALNTEFFSEIMHALRDEADYRLLVEEILSVPEGADTRDLEAIKRLATGLLKIVMPWSTVKASRFNKSDFEAYCLRPAIEMRKLIKKQLQIIDPLEYSSSVPEIGVDE